MNVCQLEVDDEQEEVLMDTAGMLEVTTKMMSDNEASSSL